MKYSYPYEKFSLAVNSMAGSPESLPKRIANAWIYHLMNLRVDEMPEDIRHKFETLHDRLTSHGSVQESIKDMGRDEAI